MIRKIAVTGSAQTERTVLAQALAFVGGYPLVQNRNIYEWQKLWHIDASKTYSFRNQFLILASSLVERISAETSFPAFVASGAVFSEALALQAGINDRTVRWKNPKEIEMPEMLLDITGKYAARHYEAVVHVRTGDSAAFDELSAGFYEHHKVAFRLYDGETGIRDVFDCVVRDLGIPLILPAEYAVYKAIRLVTFSNNINI